MKNLTISNNGTFSVASFLGRTATEIVDSERIASQIRFFLQTCDVYATDR